MVAAVALCADEQTNQRQFVVQKYIEINSQLFKFVSQRKLCETAL